MAPSNTCIWPTSYRTFCGQAPVQGRLCPEHLRRVQAKVGTWSCAWPGCEQLSGAGKGLCAHHAGITSGLMEQYR